MLEQIARIYDPQQISCFSWVILLITMIEFFMLPRNRIPTHPGEILIVLALAQDS